MKIIDALNSDIKKIEYYASAKPKYNKEEQVFFYDESSLLSLNQFDQSEQFSSFFNVIKEKTKELLENSNILDYSNENNNLGDIYLDQDITLEYDNKMNESLASLQLIEKESLNLSYIIIKIVLEDQDVLLFFKLKNPLKIIDNSLAFEPDVFQFSFQKDGLNISNAAKFNLDINLLVFILFEKDFYVLNKDYYQKYFNLETFYLKQASMIINNYDGIISDGELITKANAKLVYEHHLQIDSMISKIEDGKLNKESLKHMINELNLDLEYQEAQNKFILKKPSDLVDLVLVSCGCLGINQFSNEKYKVKNPKHLVEE